jgi:hypothetical protein
VARRSRRGTRKRVSHAMKKTAFGLLKLAVSLALLGYLLSKDDLGQVLARVRTGDPMLLGAAVLLYAVMLLLSTWRWGVLLAAQGYPAGLRGLSASYLVATFFNNFLPSNIGGDVVRVRDSARITGSTLTSLAIIAVDRILGFGALYTLALLAYAFGGEQERGLFGARPVIWGLGGVFLVLGYVFFRPGTARRLLALARLHHVGFVRERFEVLQSAVHVYRNRLPSLLLAFGASLGLQALFVGYYFCVAQALHIALPLSSCFLMVPLCTLVQAVPVSFNGWGIRETVFTKYFAQLGLTGALPFSLVGAGLIVLLSLSGAVVWNARGTASAPNGAAG